MIEKLSYDDFIRSLKMCPRLTIELIVTNDRGDLLLLKRASEPFKGQWHFSGGFLLKGELIAECVKRISRDELGIELNPTKGDFRGLIENIDGDPRGHILHYLISFIENSSPNGKYFSKIPKDTIPFQRKVLTKLGYR